jgi:hypothetical protein
LQKLQKRLKSIDTLPSADPYRDLKDFHTVNAIGFFGEKLIRRVFDTKESLKLGDLVEEGEYLNPLDKDKRFENGVIAVRKYFRNLSKSTGLGILYGGSSRLLEEKLGMSKAIALKLWINFFSTLGVLKAHLEDRLAKAIKNGYVENLFKARFYLPQLKDKRLFYLGKNKVYNTPIQSTASFLIKIAITRSSKWIDKYSMNRYTANNVAKMVKGELYSRIVLLDEKYLKKIESEDFEKGHTKLLVVNSKGKVIRESEYNIKLDRYRFEKYKMEIYF